MNMPERFRSFRILHTESSMELGGQEIRIVNEASGMMERGHLVVLAVQPNSSLESHARQRGLVVESVRMGTIRWLWLVRVFMTILAKHKIDVVNTHGSIDSWTASIAGRLSRLKPVIIRTRHKSTEISRTRRHMFLYTKLPHAVVTTGESVRQGVMEQTGLPAHRAVSIPTGVDLKRFQVMPLNEKTRRELGASQGEMIVASISFLRGYKGLVYFLEAARLVLRQRRDVKFIIVGDGPDYALLNATIRELGIGEHAQLTGYRCDIPELLANIDIFVSASTEAEGIPQALTQAMAMERPVVSTDVGGIKEVICHDHTGLLVSPRNAQAIAEQVCLLLDDKGLRERLGRSARGIIEQSYSFERMLQQTESLYLDCHVSLTRGLWKT